MYELKKKILYFEFKVSFRFIMQDFLLFLDITFCKQVINIFSNNLTNISILRVFLKMISKE